MNACAKEEGVENVIQCRTRESQNKLVSRKELRRRPGGADQVKQKKD